MYLNVKSGKVVTSTMGKGRGIRKNNFPSGKCSCERPRCLVICNVCGYIAKGRVRYECPVHPQTIFLCDITQCPKCKCHEFMLSEF